MTVSKDINYLDHLSALVLTRLSCNYNNIVLHIDIDECSEMSDNCQRTGLTPAECINNIGSYECSCTQHSGYQLSSDGISCEGIY